ncbi:hypothetical protein K488DRAFT_41490 [Vararia minispora EC-137]|uniref:Uncharacterized protein n=1 Tax=Vararia minispora EC-137 TaxID=1314806 RepID=A0ACB8QWZ1_9AGAM|nr:hypothetical protein K488DRAFT_41490 [Vararia minispora EC-137]
MCTLVRVHYSLSFLKSFLDGICCWDWLISFRTEYRLIWKANWTPIKFVYTFCRYWVILITPYVLWCFCVDHSLSTCQRVYRSPVILAMWNQLSAECILLIRTYAFFGRDKRLLAVLCAMLLGVTVYQLYVGVNRMLPLPFVSGNEGPCFPMSIPGQADILGFFVAPFCFDTLITVATLGKAFSMRRRNGPSSRLVTLFLREGIFYFILISIANLVNGAFYFQPKADMSAIMIPLSVLLSPLLACRLVRLLIIATRPR